MSAPGHFVSLGLIFCICVGCHRGYTPPAPSDPNAARVKLEEVLNSWKAGSQIPALTDSQSGCLVRDEDWEAGRILKAYAVQSSGEEFGSEVRFMVSLQVTNAQGTIVSKQARYVVSLNPSCMIRRDDTTE